MSCRIREDFARVLRETEAGRAAEVTKEIDGERCVRRFLLTNSHSGVSGLFTRARKIGKILHRRQTGCGRNPCKGFDG